MSTIKKILALIDKTAEIKQNFELKEIPVISNYSYEEQKRKTSSFFQEVIHTNKKFIDWKNRLKYELNKLNKDELINEILQLLEKFNGWNDENDFKELEIKLMILKDNIDDYKNIGKIKIDGKIQFSYEKFNEYFLKTLCNLQKNNTYSKSSTENQMNDYIRDSLTMNYEVSDQTRQGKSETGKDAGEIDIQIRKDGFPIVIIEGIKMDSFNKSNLKTHLDKLLINYDPNGCPYASLVIYSTVVNYSKFYKSIFSYMQNEYQFPYDYENILEYDKLDYSEVKHIRVLLNRNDNIQQLDIHILKIV